METVNILIGRNRIKNFVFFDSRGKRKLNENSVYIISFIKLSDKLKEFFLGGICGKLI